MQKIGIISDTHGLLDDKVIDFLIECDQVYYPILPPNPHDSPEHRPPRCRPVAGPYASGRDRPYKGAGTAACSGSLDSTLSDAAPSGSSSSSPFS